MSETKIKIEGPLPFSDLLHKLGAGKCHVDCTEVLAKVINAMHYEFQERGGEVDGKVTLEIKLACGIDGATLVTYKITGKEPESPRPASMFFLTKHGLSEENPRQSPLDFGPSSDDQPSQRKRGN